MNELFIKRTAVWTEPAVGDPEALAELKASFPGRSARRMTRLGMQVSHVLKQLEVEGNFSLIYASSYSESLTIEKFLDSFPYPSPQAFQTSIHPSGVEQFLIQNKRSIGEFFPLAGEPTILLRALDTALLCSGETVVLCGGEERGSWLVDTGVSAEHNYAWAIEVSRTKDASMTGRIHWAGLSSEEGGQSLIFDFIEALQEKKAYRYNAPNGGQLELSWGA